MKRRFLQAFGSAASGALTGYAGGRAIKKWFSSRKKAKQSHGKKITSKQKPKRPKGGSKTLTVKGRERKIEPESVHTGINSANFNLVINPKPIKHTVPGAPLVYEDVYSQLNTCANGKEFSYMLAVMGSMSQMFINTASGGVGYWQTRISALDMNPNRYSTGSAILTAGQIVAEDKMALLHSTVTLDVANLSSLAAYCDVYVAKCKSWTNKNAVSAWTDALVTESDYRANMVFPGAGAITGGTVGGITTTFIGAKPGESWGFRKAFKILKVHHLNLAPMGQERIIFSMKHNLKYDTQTAFIHNPLYTPGNNANWTEGNIGNMYPPGSVHVFAVHRGSVIKDDGTTGGTVQATTGGPELGFIINRRFLLKNIVGSMDKTKYQLGYQQMATDTTAAHATQFNIVDVAINPGIL